MGLLKCCGLPTIMTYGSTDSELWYYSSGGKKGRGPVETYTIVCSGLMFQDRAAQCSLCCEC